jgi:hypothetical protein
LKNALAGENLKQQMKGHRMEHNVGFEKEDKFHSLFAMAREDCPNLKTRTFKKIIAEINPEFMDGLFEPRPCIRRLRFVGRPCDEKDASGDNDFFEIGKIYESIDYTGATYSFAGYDNRIGCSYFEIVNE